jgi:hypothetical protein
MAPPENPTFLGHKPFLDSSIASFAETDRWVYSFRGDWSQVKKEIKRQFGNHGYAFDADRVNGIRKDMKLNPSGRRWGQYELTNKVVLRRGGVMAAGVIILEDSVELVRHCRLRKAAEWSAIGPDKPRDKGWITVILARPKKDGALSQM